MFNIEKVNISLAFPFWIFLVLLLLLTGYAVYMYWHTVPPVSRAKKILLVFLRTSALLLLLLIISEPVLFLARRESYRPVNLIFFDNSRSLTVKDGTYREDNVNSLLSGFSRAGLINSSDFFTFGNNIRNSTYDSLSLDFNEGITDISRIFDHVEESNRNIASVTVISDGVITGGSNPIYKASGMNIPVYTVGIGDSSRKDDLVLQDVLYNEYIYADVPTVISAALLNNGFNGRNVAVILSENGKVLNQQNIILADDGIQEIKFDYKPSSPGEKKLNIAVSELQEEQSADNNRKSFFINVLSNKIKVLLLAGAPSADLSFIRNTLELDENISVNSITQIARGKILENINTDRLIDSADIFFLIGFPSAETDNALMTKIFNKISGERVPYFLLLSGSTDFNKLRNIQSELPFVIRSVVPGFSEAVPDINMARLRNPMVQSGGENTASAWNNLPPVYVTNSEISPKPESEVLASVKIRNVPVDKPLIITRKLGSKKSVAVTAKDIWKWKLQTAVKNLRLFDSFLHNSLKWLNTGEDQKQVVIRTSKKLYSLGEEIPFTAQVYDAAFNPVPDARVTVNISSGDRKDEIILNPLGSGIYEAVYETNKTGDYSFNGNAVLDENLIGSDNGSFNVGEVDIEMLNTRMDYAFLSLLANETKGEFFLPAESDQLYEILRQTVERTPGEKIVTSELSLWSNEWLLVIVILLLSAEWFIRKQSGML